MLVSLSIKDFILIQQLSLDLGGGFTVLTGETGAGKSILLGAIGLILGGRADAGYVRPGAEKAELTAEFDIANSVTVKRIFSELDVDPEECILRRTIDKTGRSRAWVNGTPVTIKQLKTIVGSLVDIHGQHEHYSLLEVASHIGVLDRFGSLEEQSKQVSNLWRIWRAAKLQFEESKQLHETTNRRVTELTEQLDELESLRFDKQEWRKTQEDHLRLSNLSQLTTCLGQVVDILDGDGPTVSRALSQVRAQFSQVVDFDHTVEKLSSEAESIEVLARELDREVRRYLDGLEAEPNAIDALDRRISEVHGAAKKLGVKPEDLPTVKSNMERELQDLLITMNLDELEANEKAAADEYHSVAEALSQRRATLAHELETAVNASLADLSMQGVQFKVSADKKNHPDAGGLDSVAFYVSTNPGVAAKPLGEIASGGELSRISLAIQSVLHKEAPTSTIIFDEVDTGVGGAVAEVVGRMLREVSDNAQVLCVTHLPQVAALAHSHWRVLKSQSNNTSLTEIELLDFESRVGEVARMLAGATVTEEARAHARQLLEAGRS